MKKIHINNDDNYATPPDFYEELNKCFDFRYIDTQELIRFEFDYFDLFVKIVL